MKNVLRLELRKLRTRKSFYICTIIMVAIIALTILTMNVISGAFGESGISSLISALSASYFTMIAGIFVALYVCEDYTNQTIKNIYAKGYSRSKVYLAKLITVLIATTIMMLIVYAASFILGTIFFGHGELESYKFLALLGTQYIVAIAEITFVFMLASVIRKTGGVIACIIVAPMLLGLLLGLVDVVVSFENIYLSELWVSNLLSGVSTLDATNEEILIALFGSLAYIPIFGAIGLYFNKKIQL